MSTQPNPVPNSDAASLYRPPSASSPTQGWPYIQVPALLRQCENWVGWKLGTRDGKETKIPYDVKTGYPAKANDPSTWSSFEQVLAATDVLQGGDYDGPGFELGGTDIVGIDFDNAINAKGVVDPYALEILTLLGDPYCEISPSGTGLHAFVKCDALPEGGRKLSQGHTGIEIYHGREAGRYFTITGGRVLGDGIPKIDDISLPYFLISQNRDEQFKKLWLGDISDYDNDDSSADMALVGILARRFSRDPQKIDAAFRWSKLGQRDKWTQRKDYRERTIAKAIGKESHSSEEPNETIATKTLNVKRANEVVTKKIQWLWRQRVPLGKLTMFVGDPDNGKSMAAGDVAAAGTTQRDWVDGRNEIPPYEVLMLIGEDDIEDTTVPRLQAAGADLSKVRFIESVTLESGPGKTPEDREFQFDTDLKEIEKILESNPNIRLLVIDPVSNYLGRTRMVNEQEVRAILIPLKKLAAKMNIAVLGVMHLNKKSELNAINRVGGAMAFVGVARATWLFARDPEDFDKLQMLRVKCNIAKRSGGLLFTIGVKPVEVEGSPEWAPYIQWGAETEATANDVLRPKTAVGRPREERSGAAKWLGEYLAAGAQPQKEIEEQGKGLHDFTKGTLIRAKKELRVRSFQKERQWFWEMPSDPDGGDNDRL